MGWPLLAKRSRVAACWASSNCSYSAEVELSCADANAIALLYKACQSLLCSNTQEWRVQSTLARGTRLAGIAHNSFGSTKSKS
eukprot:5483144-Amphidinium_carterae.2